MAKLNADEKMKRDMDRCMKVQKLYRYLQGSCKFCVRPDDTVWMLHDSFDGHMWIKSGTLDEVIERIGA